MFKINWGKKAIGDQITLNIDTNTITMNAEEYESNSAFLSTITEGKEVYHWKLKVINNKLNALWSSTMSLYGIYDDDNKPRGYVFAYNYGKLVHLNGTRCTTDYGIKCNDGDIIEMICDMDKLELKFIINNTDYGKAFDIKKAKYRAVVDMMGSGDSIMLL